MLVGKNKTLGGGKTTIGIKEKVIYLRKTRIGGDIAGWGREQIVGWRIH